MIEVDQYTFAKVGFFCFLVITLCHIFSVIYFWNTYFILSKISNFMYSIFYIFLTLMFYTIVRDTPKITKGEIDKKDIDELLKEVK